MNTIEKQEYPEDLILAYLNNELEERLCTQLEQWITEDESHKRYFYEMTEVWLAVAATKEKQEFSRQAYERFKTRIEPQTTIKRATHYIRRFAAAVVLGGLILGAGYYWGNSYTNDTTLHSIYTVEAPMGSQSRIEMSDGTIVWLNVGSKLSYTAGYSQKERNVKIEGEGYFEVAPNEKLPFVVNANEIDVKVIGTKFSVKAYADEDNIEVILAEGSVKFINKHNLEASFLLKPEQRATYNKKDGKVTVKKVLASQASDWTKGIHFFDDVTLEQIVRQLEKSFDVTFIFKNESKRRLTFYGDFKKEDSLDEILVIMSSSGKFSYKKTENVIEIY